jgi:ABC-type uncharacterized transport system permease subunit
MTAALVLTAAAPLLWAALGELLGERAGVLNIGIEGVMLVACLAAALVAPTWGPWWGVVAAAGAGAVMNLGFAAVVAAGADQVVAGTGLVLVGAGLSGTVFRRLQAVGALPPLLPTLPWGPLEVAPLVAAGILMWWFGATKLGLKVRAVGENPDAAAAAGVSPVTVRVVVLGCAGVLTGLAGATLVLRAAGSFVEGMTAGRGFLALALVMLGRWRPLPVAAGALLLGAATSAQFSFQALGLGSVPYHLVLVVPYLLTLLVLAALPPGTSGSPAALGAGWRSQK